MMDQQLWTVYQSFLYELDQNVRCFCRSSYCYYYRYSPRWCCHKLGCAATVTDWDDWWFIRLIHSTKSLSRGKTAKKTKRRFRREDIVVVVCIWTRLHKIQNEPVSHTSQVVSKAWLIYGNERMNAWMNDTPLTNLYWWHI